MVFVTGGSGFVGRHLIGHLKQQGNDVRALARSEHSAELVRQAGADVIMGDVRDGRVLAKGMAGCDIVFHAAADLRPWGKFAQFYDINVRGTRAVMRAAHIATVKRVIHVSTEAVLADGSELINVDETRPIPRFPLGSYARTKALAEGIVRQANTDTCAAIIVRPRFVWGAGDTSMLPHLVHAARLGRFAWIDEGRYFTSTCHVENLCEGLWCAAQRGRAGACYFVTDGTPVEVRSFGEALLRTQGIEPPRRSVPRRAAMITGVGMELLWRGFGLRGNPPVTRAMVATMGCEITLNDSKARHELGYRERMTMEDGIQAMKRI